MAADIESSVRVGSVNVHQQDGFNGAQDSLHSINYPDRSNLNINLATTIGSVDIGAKYS